jgi:AraC-like DNA-binding protein
MIFDLLNHVYSALFVFTFIVVAELFYQFKRNNSIKLVLIGFCFGVMYYCAINIYCSYYGFNKYWLEAPFPVISICYLSLLSLLCYGEVKKYLVIYFTLMILIYLCFVLYDVFELDLKINTSQINYERPSMFFLFAKLLLVLSSIFITIILYFNILKKYKTDNIYHNAVKKWVSISVTCLTFLIFVAIVKFFFGYNNSLSKYVGTSVLFITVISFLFRPKFLNKSILSLTLSNQFNKNSINGIKLEVFNEAFFTQLYFLNPDASIEDFSKKNGISAEDLYRFIYNSYSSGFNDLVNENRVNYFIDVVKSKKYNNYTIDALSQMAGFSSRHHLYKPFKKFHGGVPSDFMKTLDFA